MIVIPELLQMIFQYLADYTLVLSLVCKSWRTVTTACYDSDQIRCSSANICKFAYLGQYNLVIWLKQFVEISEYLVINDAVDGYYNSGSSANFVKPSLTKPSLTDLKQFIKSYSRHASIIDFSHRAMHQIIIHKDYDILELVQNRALRLCMLQHGLETLQRLLDHGFKPCNYLLQQRGHCKHADMLLDWLVQNGYFDFANLNS